MCVKPSGVWATDAGIIFWGALLFFCYGSSTGSVQKTETFLTGRKMYQKRTQAFEQFVRDRDCLFVFY